MALMNEFPVISSNLKAGYGVFGTADPYTTSLQNNGAQNPLGSLCFIPAPAQSGTALATSAGYGSGLWVKYVLYKSTANPAMVAGPAPVYWADETFTTVTGQASEANIASTSVSAAGWLLPNTGTVSGVGVGTSVSATILNNGGLGSYVFIGIQGFIPSCYLAAGAKGNWLYASGNFATTGVAADGATTYNDFKNIGIVWGTVSSNIGDVLAIGQEL